MRIGDIDIGDARVKEVDGYDGRYLICDDGTLISVYRYANIHGVMKKICKPKRIRVALDKKGYVVANLYKCNGKPKSCKVHRLVAMAFLENPKGKRCVCHKDNNPMNNNVSNLYWGTDQENQDQAWADGLHHSQKPVVQIRKDGSVVSIYKSQCEASRISGVPHANIWKCINNERKTAGGFIWRG